MAFPENYGSVYKMPDPGKPVGQIDWHKETKKSDDDILHFTNSQFLPSGTDEEDKTELMILHYTQ